MRLHALSTLVLSAMEARNLQPVLAQRAVMNDHMGVATAADILALDRTDNSLVVLELKTGHDQGKELAAVKNGVSQKMRKPLSRASDCVLNRHFAQLAATHQMLTSDPVTMKALCDEGITRVEGLLMYCTDDNVDCYELNEWWKGNAIAIVRSLQ
jgi:hypothetical protein